MKIDVIVDRDLEFFHLKFPDYLNSSNIKIYNSTGKMIINDTLVDEEVKIGKHLLDYNKFYLILLSSDQSVFYKLLYIN